MTESADQGVVLARIRTSGLPLRFARGRFALDSVGELTPDQVRSRDQRGALVWADDAARSWFRANYPAESPRVVEPKRAESAVPDRRAAATPNTAPVSPVSPASTKVTGRRIVAFLLDILLVNLIQLPLTLPMAAAATGDANMDAIARGLGLLVGGFYFIVCEAAWGRTFGKAALGLRVVNLNGQGITFGQSLGRNAARYIDLLLLGLPAFVAISGSSLHQRFGDQWAKTAVIRT